MVVTRPPMMQAKLNGIRNVEGENPLGKGSEGSRSIVREHCRRIGGIMRLRAARYKISARSA
jgi:hypothetical protein